MRIGRSASRSCYHSQYFVWSVFVDTDCNKRGPTSRPVVGAEIQTSCNFEAGLLDRCCILDCVHCLCNNAGFECRYNLRVYDCSFRVLSSNLDLFLYKDFPHPSIS